MIFKNVVSSFIISSLSVYGIHAYAITNNKEQASYLQLYIPSSPASYELSAGSFFLRPGGSNDYSVLVNPFNPSVATPILSPSWEAKGISPNYGSGFLLNLRYGFANTGHDINVYWGRLRSTNNATFPVDRNPPPAQQMTGPFWDVGPDAGPTNASSGQLTTHYDVLHGDVGQHLNFGDRIQSRFLMGVSGLWLYQNNRANFSGVDPVLGLYNFGIATHSTYNAAGLRLGIEGEYLSPFQVSVVSLLSGTLFVGSAHPLTQTYGSGAILASGGIAENKQSISHNSYVQAVPALDAKLGLKYSHNYHDKLLSIEAGYQASIYINAIQNYVPSTYVPGSLGIVSGSIFLQSLLKNTDSFSVDGPYVTASFKM